MSTFGSGFSFGSSSAAPAASTGFGFGTPAVTTIPTGTLSFGGFSTGAPTAAAPSTGFSGFGATAVPAATTSAPSNFSFSGLGTSKTTASTGFGLGSGFGTTTSMAPTLGTSFGFGGFGGAPTTAANTGFSFAPTNTGFGLGTGTAQSTGLFGKPTGLGGIGTGQLAVTQAPSGDQLLASLTAALFYPALYGDERDAVIAKYNRLQAYWGTGKGFYAIGVPPIEFSPENPFCKFKTVGYSILPETRNEDGLISLRFNHKETDIRSQQPQVVDGLQRVLGNRPTLSVCVDGVKPAPDNKSEVTIYVIERALTGVSRRIPTNELYSFLNQPMTKQQLTASLGVDYIIPKAAPSSEQLKQYLENPPAGIDPLVWQQALMDNPDSEHLIPVPMIGFSELQRRLKNQDEETKVHQIRLNIIGNELKTLQNNHRNAEAKISQHKRKHLELSHRILKVMVRQEIARKLGLAVQADEEQFRVHLEAIHDELSAPNQAKGRLNELMAQIRLQREHILSHANERYTMDNMLQDEIKQHLRQQQEGLKHLVAVVKEDMKCLKLMEDGLKKESYQRK